MLIHILSDANTQHVLLLLKLDALVAVYRQKCKKKPKTLSLI